MEPDKLRELRRLTETVAAWGNWIEDGHYGTMGHTVKLDNPDSDADGLVICRSGLDTDENMQYIAALNPVVVLELLDLVDELLGKVK